MKNCSEVAQELGVQDDFDYRQLEVGGSSFSTPYVARTRDYSFSNGQLEVSPAFTCKSSFSSPLVDNCTPCSAFQDFSFANCQESSMGDFPALVPSVPSFTFFSPCSTVEEGTSVLGIEAKMPKTEAKHRESNLGKLFVLPDFALPIKREIGELEHKSEIRRGGINSSRISGIHSKRNHTIGLGELDQLDVIVTESVIRWASCTHIPTAPSLRLSLVC